MYLYVYYDGKMTQQAEEPTQDDFDSVEFGSVDLVRVDGTGHFQIYEPSKSAWVDIALTGENQDGQ